MTKQIIPQGKFAKFTQKGGFKYIGLTYTYIFGTWLPKSGYKENNRNPDFEWYDERFIGPFDDNSIFDIYISII